MKNSQVYEPIGGAADPLEQDSRRALYEQLIKKYKKRQMESESQAALPVEGMTSDDASDNMRNRGLLGGLLQAANAVGGVDAAGFNNYADNANRADAMDVASYEQGMQRRREAGDAALTNQMEELKLLDADQAYTRKEDEFSREQTRLDSPIPEEILTAFNKHLARLNKPSMQLKPGVTPRIIESSKVYNKLFETFVDSDKQLDKEAADRAAKKAAVERARKYALDPKTFFDKTTGEEVPGYFDKSAGKYYDADGVPIDTKRYVMKIDKAASIRSTIEAKTEEAQSVSRGTELGKAGGKAQVEKVKAVVNEGIVKDKMVRLMNAYDKADKEGGVGFIGGTKTIAKKTARQSAGPATDRLYNELGFDLAAFMKEISGAAVPDKEVERLSSLMPNIMQSREAFQNSLAVLMQQAIDTAKKYSRENEAIGELGMQQSTNEAPSSERKLPTTATSASKLKDYSKGAGR